MAVFISYNHADVKFVDTLAKNLLSNRHHVWIDKWELNIGDSLIDRIQAALTDSSAILVILSKASVGSEWCRKELNAGLTRELRERRVLVLPCLIEDCDIPLFLQDKMYADFRSDKDVALKQVNDALMRYANLQQGRLESPDFFTDWAYDWKKGKSSGLWYFEWVFVDHGERLEYCVMTRFQMACSPPVSDRFQSLDENGRQALIHSSLVLLERNLRERAFKLRLTDAFEVFEEFYLEGANDHDYLVEISSRRLGIDNGKDTLVHADLMLERAVAHTDPSRQSKNSN